MSDAPSSDPQGAIGFDFVDRRVIAAVERVAATDPNPSDPFRGLYISDETALRLTQGDSSSSADERLQPLHDVMVLAQADEGRLPVRREFPHAGPVAPGQLQRLENLQATQAQAAVGPRRCQQFPRRDRPVRSHVLREHAVDVPGDASALEA